MPNQTDIHLLKDKLSGLAKQIAEQNFGIQLDYSIESIKQVENILGVIHKDYKKTRSTEGLQGIAFEFGAYIVKVVEKNFGSAEWKSDHEIFGENSFPLQWKNSTLFPVEWCRKRIFDGPGDDIWSKFQVYILAKKDE